MAADLGRACGSGFSFGGGPFSGARAVIFFLQGSGPCTRVKEPWNTREKKGRPQRWFWRGKCFIWWWERKVETAPPHALETNLEACADAKRKKRDERVLFSDWLIGVVCFFFFFTRVSFYDRRQDSIYSWLLASGTYLCTYPSIYGGISPYPTWERDLRLKMECVVHGVIL